MQTDGNASRFVKRAERHIGITGLGNNASAVKFGSCADARYDRQAFCFGALQQDRPGTNVLFSAFGPVSQLRVLP